MYTCLGLNLNFYCIHLSLKSQINELKTTHNGYKLKHFYKTSRKILILRPQTMFEKVLVFRKPFRAASRETLNTFHNLSSSSDH